MYRLFHLFKRKKLLNVYNDCWNEHFCNMRCFYKTIYIEDFDLTTDQQKQKARLKGLPIIHHHGYVCELPPKHRFPMAKFHRVYDFLILDGVVDDKQVIQPKELTEKIACCVHTPEYVHKFFNGETTKDEQRTTGFAWTSGLANRVRLETGGTILAGLISLERGLASSTAGGTHHAFPDRGSGFCLINDLAVTAQYLIDLKKVERVLIVDLDVHQGDGTAFIFEHNPLVFTFSMHCEKNFPFRKQKSDLDIGLEKGTDDKQFMAILSSTLPELLTTFRPDLVLYDAGVDPHYDDELGKLSLSDEGLLNRDEYVLHTVVSFGIPVATVIGGGYSTNIDKLALRHTIIHRAASKVWKNKSL